jgi:hypothetical protein
MAEETEGLVDAEQKKKKLEEGIAKNTTPLLV